MIEHRIDVLTWFSERELNFTPKHFTVTTHPLSFESKQWVLEKLSGRFSLVFWSEAPIVAFMSPLGCIAFEDPKEAILYELRWS